MKTVALSGKRFLVAGAAITCCLLLINACSSGWVGTDGGGQLSSQLIKDQMSPIPIVGGQPTNVYFYVYNPSNESVNGLEWSTSSSLSTSDSNFSSKTKLGFGKLFGQKQLADGNIDPITIANDSGCKIIYPKSACRVLLSANSIGSVLLSASNKSGTKLLTSIVSAYKYSSPVSDGADSLTLAILPNLVVARGGFASLTLSVVNNSSHLIDVSNLLGDTPNNIRWQLVSCDNPLPARSSCQVRITYVNTSFINSSTQTNLNQTQLSLNPKGSIVDSDGSITPLPEQNSKSVVIFNPQNLGTLQLAYPKFHIKTFSSNPKDSSTVSYIQNTGNGPANLGTLSVNSPAVSIINDKCSNQTLNIDEMCSYELHANHSDVTIANDILLSLSYYNGAYDVNSSAIIDYQYTIIPSAVPTISLSAPSELNQDALSGIITVSNTGNVPLNNLGLPIITPQNPNITLSDQQQCSKTPLEVGSSCSYNILYNPEYPSEDSSITINGISASYIDPETDENTLVSFTNSTSININSIFKGHLYVNDLNMKDTNSTGSLIITNDGNYKAQILNIGISGSNLSLGAINCLGDLAPGASCVESVSLTNVSEASSGNGVVLISYNDSNSISPVTSGANISWVIGDFPSLAINFQPSSLSAIVNSVVSSTMTLLNNGRNKLSNIHLPALSPPLSYSETASCNLSGGGSLNIGESCTAEILYSPNSAISNHFSPFESITASYGSPQSAYVSGQYGINLEAIAPSSLIFVPTDLTVSLYWPQINNHSEQLVIKNVGSATAVIDSITTTDPYLAISGCNGASLGSTESCLVTVLMNYPSQATTYGDNGSIIVNYSDPGGNYSTAAQINASLNMKPVVNNILQVSGSLPPSLLAGTPTTVMLNLNNQSTATNNGDASVKVNMDSLISSGFNVTNAGSGSISATLNTTGIGNQCSTITGSLTLTQNESCNVNIVLTATGTINGSITTPQVEVKPSYSYKEYTDFSTTPNDSSLVSTGFLAGVITVINPAAELSFSYNPTSISVEQGFLPAPQAILTITNVGNAALTSIDTSEISRGVSLSVPSACNTLLPGGSCDVTITIPTSTVRSQNLFGAPVYFSDAYYPLGYAELPSFDYTVFAPDQPSISTSLSTSGCSSVGSDGLSGNCFLNPSLSNELGSASAFKLTVTYTNSSSVPAESFTVNPSVSLSNYSVLENNCIEVSLLQGSSCTLVYQLNNPNVQTSNLNIPINTSIDNRYTYKYGSQLQLNATRGPSLAPSTLQVTSTQPSLSLSLTSSNMFISSSQTALVTLSNWYLPTGSGAISFTSSNTGAVDTPAPCNVNLVGGGGSCSTAITSTAGGGTSSMTANITAPNSGIVTSNTQSLTTFLSYAYITKYNFNSVTKCQVSVSDKTLGNCSNLSVNFSYPYGIGINNGYAYISDFSSNVYKCAISGITGDLGPCAPTGSGFSGPNSIEFNAGYAYVINSGFNPARKCDISLSNGDLINCSSAAGGTFNTGVAFDNGYAYMSATSAGRGALFTYSVAANGNLNSSNSYFFRAVGLYNGVGVSNNYVYLTANPTPILNKCSILGGGAISTGSCTGENGGVNNPTGMAINYGYTFVVSNSSSIVSSCLISTTNGALLNCRASSTGQQAGAANIAFYP